MAKGQPLMVVHDNIFNLLLGGLSLPIVVVVKPGACAVWSLEEMLSEHTASRAAEAPGGLRVC